MLLRRLATYALVAVTSAPSPSPLMITSLVPVRGNSVTSGVGVGVSGVGVGVGVGVGASVGVTAGIPSALIFTVAMLAGMIAFGWWQASKSKSA